MTNDKTLPQHVAIIMDGNGRWAKQGGCNGSLGIAMERKQCSAFETAAKMELKCLTLFAFSTENWDRPKRGQYFDEPTYTILRKELKMRQQYTIQSIGNLNALPRK